MISLLSSRIADRHSFDTCELSDEIGELFSTLLHRASLVGGVRSISSHPRATCATLYSHVRRAIRIFFFLQPANHFPIELSQLYVYMYVYRVIRVAIGMDFSFFLTETRDTSIGKGLNIDERRRYSILFR